MAANLAVQYAAGIPVPGCHGQQLRTNLVTKAHKTTIMAMAANIPAAMQCEASALVSIPTQLHRNNTKRNKTIVAAYPTKIEVLTPGIPFYTEGKLENLSGKTLTLDDKDIWQGSRSGVDQFPTTISEGDVGKFKHSAESGGKITGSVGALEYKLDGGLKWIIAWSNPENELNKVYSDILEEIADWEQIKRDLETKGQTKCTTSHFGYSSEIEIDATSGTPTLKATLKPSPIPTSGGEAVTPLTKK